MYLPRLSDLTCWLLVVELDLSFSSVTLIKHLSKKGEGKIIGIGVFKHFVYV